MLLQVGFILNFFYGINSLHKRIKLSFCYAQEGLTLITDRDSFKSTKLPLISPSIVPSNVSFDHCFLGNRLLPLSPRFSLWYLESARTRTRYHIRSFTPLSMSGVFKLCLTAKGGNQWREPKWKRLLISQVQRTANREGRRRTTCGTVIPEVQFGVSLLPEYSQLPPYRHPDNTDSS